VQSNELQVDAFVGDPGESEMRAARIGSRVRLKDESGMEDRFTIKLEDRFAIKLQEDKDPEEGRLSLAAPLVRALLGRWAGEEVHVWTPTGARAVTIVEVD
jgi:transcription elongation factor GreA